VHEIELVEPKNRSGKTSYSRPE